MLSVPDTSQIARRTPERLVDAVDLAAAPFSTPAARHTWGGGWLGHPVHPMLTDLPIGFWTSAVVLDVLGPRRYARASRALIALGVLSVPPTAMAGLSDYTTIEDPQTRRIGALHGTLNATATVLFAMSWWKRRHGGGRAIAMVASVVASAAGYLGGVLAFGDDAGEQSDAGGSAAPTEEQVARRAVS